MTFSHKVARIQRVLQALDFCSVSLQFTTLITPAYQPAGITDYLLPLTFFTNHQVNIVFASVLNSWKV